MKDGNSGSGIFRGLRASLAKRKDGTSAKVLTTTEATAAQPKIEVTTGDGPSPSQFLNVKNLGKEAIFHAKGQIISSQNSNSFLTGVYPLGWGRLRHPWVVIPKGETKQVLIAAVSEVYAGSLFHLALIQAGPSVERHWARWNAQDKLLLPRFGLKVSIIAEGSKESWIGYFSVTPENHDEAGVRLTFRGREGLQSVL